MRKVKKLRRGSKIAIISPSSGLPHLFPGIYELGLKNLRELFGFEIVEMSTSRMSPDALYRNPEIRAQDINKAFEDESIDGIITSIGGYESVRILKYLDVDKILNHPKLIMGFSDATTFLSYFNYLGMTTFYGPSVMAGFAQLRHLPQAYTEHIKDIFFKEKYPYDYTPYTVWTNGYKDWSKEETLGECTELYPNKKGWTFLQGKQETEGMLWGGCIEVLEFLKSTKYWPEDDFWKDKILFFETSEDKPLPEQVGYMLRNYGIQGILNQVNGVIFGRPKDYTEEENKRLKEIVLKIMSDEFKACDVPVIMDMDVGHTDPKVILPLGCKVRLEATTNKITLLENPFSD